MLTGPRGKTPIPGFRGSPGSDPQNPGFGPSGATQPRAPLDPVRPNLAYFGVRPGSGMGPKGLKKGSKMGPFWGSNLGPKMGCASMCIKRCILTPQTVDRHSHGFWPQMAQMAKMANFGVWGPKMAKRAKMAKMAIWGCQLQVGSTSERAQMGLGAHQMGLGGGPNRAQMAQNRGPNGPQMGSKTGPKWGPPRDGPKWWVRTSPIWEA